MNCKPGKKIKHHASDLAMSAVKEHMAELGLGVFLVDPRERRGGSCVGDQGAAPDQEVVEKRGGKSCQ